MSARAVHTVLLLGLVCILLFIALFFWVTYFASYQTAVLAGTVSPSQKKELMRIIEQSENRHQLSKRLSQHAWIEHYRVEQSSWNTISVSINASQPIARFSDDTLLLASGMRMHASDYLYRQPMISLGAPSGNYTRLAQQLTLIRQACKPLRLTPQAYRVVADASRLLTTREGVAVMFHTAGFKKRLARFVDVYTQYQQLLRHNKINYYDLRYDYGIAVASREVYAHATQ